MPNKKVKILVVDDEVIVRDSLTAWFRDEGYDVESAENGKLALEKLTTQKFDIALIDIKMPGMDGLELQKRIKEKEPEITIIIMTAYASIQTAVEALKQGAYEYLLKPFDPEQVSHLIRNAIERSNLRSLSSQHKQTITDYEKENPIIGQSAAIQKIMALVNKVATADSAVLITGESGTGKELIAKSIHIRSPRRLMPLVSVNCGSLPEGVLESELFGHEKGAFTGAQFRRKGRFELADGGTIFLDEIGDICAKTQSDLLRVLEEKRVTRIGGTQNIDVDFRIVSATNKNFDKLIEEGRFREDLFYRLNVFNIHLPPLRERPEDIMAIAQHVLEKLNIKMNLCVRSFSKEAEKAMLGYHWPGNVRELQNSIERAMIICPSQEISAECMNLRQEKMSLFEPEMTLSELEKEHISHILTRHQGNVSESAKILGIDRTTLYNKMKKYEIRG